MHPPPLFCTCSSHVFNAPSATHIATQKTYFAVLLIIVDIVCLGISRRCSTLFVWCLGYVVAIKTGHLGVIVSSYLFRFHCSQVSSPPLLKGSGIFDQITAEVSNPPLCLLCIRCALEGQLNSIFSLFHHPQSSDENTPVSTFLLGASVVLSGYGIFRPWNFNLPIYLYLYSCHRRYLISITTGSDSLPFSWRMCKW